MKEEFHARTRSLALIDSGQEASAEFKLGTSPRKFSHERNLTATGLRQRANSSEMVSIESHNESLLRPNAGIHDTNRSAINIMTRTLHSDPFT